ncbi:MAG: DUF402 domain-containing protein [Chloroflexota bacterium]|nr:DUF402 domain-containing protein [Chloroflexota bacterium]
MWPLLPAGTVLTVIKLAPDGSEATRYPGTLRLSPIHEPWILIEAQWTSRPLLLDGLAFTPGGTLWEYFSAMHWFNVFAIHTPEGTPRGWYANVTYPVDLDLSTDPPILTWRDLYLDVILLPDGTFVVRDEDELAASGLASSDPALHSQILAAKDELVRRASAREFPFHAHTADHRD